MNISTHINFCILKKRKYQHLFVLPHPYRSAGQFVKATGGISISKCSLLISGSSDYVQCTCVCSQAEEAQLKRKKEDKSQDQGKTLYQGKTIKSYHDFLQRQGNPPECQIFAVQDEACRVFNDANLWHGGGFLCPCTKWWLIIFLQPLSISITKPPFLL